MLSAEHNEQAVGKVLLMLLAAFPSSNLSAEMAGAKIAGYRLALADLPTWSVDEAAQAWLKGEAGDGRFAPSPPEIRKTAAALVERVRNEADGYARLLGAQVPAPPNPPVAPERIAELVRTLGGKTHD